MLAELVTPDTPLAAALALTPGGYLRKRREAAGLSIEDLALKIDCLPRVSARTRIELLAAIEADAAPISPGTAVVLHMAFPFDPIALDQLATVHAGGAGARRPHLCRVCACSWHDPCLTAGRGCAWVDSDLTLCTACRDRAANDAAGRSAARVA